MTRWGSGLAALAGLLMLALPALAAQRNVLLVIADDVGADSLALFNTNATATFPLTPTLDALSANGVRFLNAHAYPTCSPTRMSILTGRYGFRTGVGYAIIPPGDPQLPSGEATLPELLAAHSGHRHACVGKWHMSFTNSTPNTLGGFSHFSGALQGALPDYNAWNKVVNGVATAGYTVYATTDNANDAISWINGQGTNAWLLWLAFNAGHTPLHKPPNELHSLDGLPGTTPHINNNPRRYFEAMVEAMDTELGRVLTNVSLTNTTVIFIGDNGSTGQTIQPPYAAGRAKGTLYEGGIRVPFLIAGAGVTSPNRTSTNLVHVVDLHSTILELAGVDVAAAHSNRVVDSRTLTPILNNLPETNARVVLAENFSSSLTNMVAGRALLDGRYKLIQFRNSANELYDLVSDYLEATNLLAGPLNAAQQAAHDALVLQSEAWQPRPVLTNAAISGGQFTLRFTPVQQYGYTLERRDTAADGGWLSVTSVTPTSSDVNLQLRDTFTGATNRFHRVQVAVPY